MAALAASYDFGIVKNHPFVDGNKRSGFVVMRTILLVNGKDLDASHDEKYSTFLALASGTLDEPQLADWIRDHPHRKKRKGK